MTTRCYRRLLATGHITPAPLRIILRISFVVKTPHAHVDDDPQTGLSSENPDPPPNIHGFLQGVHITNSNSTGSVDFVKLLLEPTDTETDRQRYTYSSSLHFIFSERFGLITNNLVIIIE